MPKASRIHHSDEFGKSSSSGALIGVDAPTIGAASSILVDGIVERESGVTPPPPPISVRAIAIALVIMLVFGLVLATVLSRLPEPRFPARLEGR